MDTLDKDGVTRTDWDIGAFEFFLVAEVDSAFTPEISISPTSDTNLISPIPESTIDSAFN